MFFRCSRKFQFIHLQIVSKQQFKVLSIKRLISSLQGYENTDLITDVHPQNQSLIFNPTRKFFTENFNEEYPIIHTKLGDVKGKTAFSVLGGKYFSFQGIPYAKAPIADLRFKAPQPIEPWSSSGLLDATQEGPECPSTHLMLFKIIGREDNCLHLNIYSKELPAPGKKLKPVMVFIHGGAFLQGSNKTEFYGPDYLMTEDVIQVFINYRLGVFGFLCLEDERLGVLGNAGLKDQVLALKWIKDNIGSFGGDADNVTIYGESAGAAAVHYLVLSPTTKGLFHKAIIQSGTALNVWAYGQRGAAHITEKLKIRETDEEKILEQLLHTPARRLVKAQMKLQQGMVPAFKRVYGPVIEKPSDEAFLTEDPIDVLKSGNYNKVPMIIGVNSNEGLLYEFAKRTGHVKGSLDLSLEVPFDLKLRKEDYEEISGKLNEYYRLGETKVGNDMTNVYDLKSDNHFVYGIHRAVTHHVETCNCSIFYYLFSFDGEHNYYKKFATAKSLIFYGICTYFLNKFEKESLRKIIFWLAKTAGFNNIEGVCHADDLGYQFKSFYSMKVVPESKEAAVIRNMTKLWTNFARHGNPTPRNEEESMGVVWKPVEKDGHHFLNIGADLKMDKNPFKKRNEFWDDIYGKYSRK